MPFVHTMMQCVSQGAVLRVNFEAGCAQHLAGNQGSHHAKLVQLARCSKPYHAAFTVMTTYPFLL